MNQDSNGTGGRAAVAAARIAKGAMSGGLGGAAAGAVTSFLPEIIKLGAILIVAAILIPLLVFVGVPHIVFGYDNAFYDDIISLTDRAEYVDSIYQQIESYNLDAIDTLVSQAEASFSGSYDEISVDSDISNTDIYWFIAINAVEYQQDLYAMDETTIMDMLMQKLSFTAFIDSVESVITNEDDEEVTVTIRKLEVSVKDLNPEELMDKLDFTEEETSWAELLYETLEKENPLNGSHSGGYQIPGEALTDERFAAMIEEAEKYLGYPYVYGGSNPKTSFDCSGFVCWVINQSGIGSVGRTTAQGLYDYFCTPVSAEDLKPGDLVFFHNTYKHYEHITHVGIYVGG